tara:strand:+ start:718 stop:1014 length:297 start_codon:yes stop_codon:yes gene_type:complete
MKDGKTEKVRFNRHEGKVEIKTTYDTAPSLEKAKQLRDAGATDFGESKLVGHIPMFLVTEWMKEAGVDPSNTHARAEILRKKLLSGEFDKFRVWKGTF